jgi:hypothetical protein
MTTFDRVGDACTLSRFDEKASRSGSCQQGVLSITIDCSIYLFGLSSKVSGLS